MPIKIEVNEKEFTDHPGNKKNRKLIIFSEAQLLKGLTAKKAHADEIAEINPQEFENHQL